MNYLPFGYLKGASAPLFLDMRCAFSHNGIAMKTQRFTHAPRMRAAHTHEVGMGGDERMLCLGCGMSVIAGMECPACAKVAVVDRGEEPDFVEADRAEMW